MNIELRIFDFRVSKVTPVNVITNELTVYKDLTNDLINKKINKCSYIKSITRGTYYNGFDWIKIKYNNDITRCYIIESTF